VELAPPLFSLVPPRDDRRRLPARLAQPLTVRLRSFTVLMLVPPPARRLRGDDRASAADHAPRILHAKMSSPPCSLDTVTIDTFHGLKANRFPSATPDAATFDRPPGHRSPTKRPRRQCFPTAGHGSSSYQCWTKVTAERGRVLDGHEAGQRSARASSRVLVLPRTRATRADLCRVAAGRVQAAIGRRATSPRAPTASPTGYRRLLGKIPKTAKGQDDHDQGHDQCSSQG